MSKKVGPVSILLVDDNPGDLLVLEAILQDLDEQLVKCRNGAEALQRLAEDDFAVVLLDVRMGGLDGFETAKRIRAQERSRDTPIIFITAYDASDFPVAAAYALGVVDYLVKPLVPAILRAKVLAFVELFRKSDQLRRQAEQLRSSEERFRLLVDGVQDYAICLLDPQGRIASWNIGAERIFLYKAREVVGRHFSCFFTPSDVQAGKPEDELHTAAAAGRLADEGWRLRKDESRFWANVVITALRDAAGNLKGFSKIIRDLSERRAIELALQAAHAELEKRVSERTAELAQANDALRESDRRKDAFLAMLSHELRAPLAPISNAVQILKAEGPGGPHHQWSLDVIADQVKQMARIVDDLLEVSRIVRGKIKLTRERILIADVVERAVEAVKPLAAEHAHELTTSVPSEAIVLDADLTRLVQVLGNLLNNAVKYTEDGGRIRLSVCRQEQEVVISVRDTGVGIRAEMLPRVFEPFAQVDQSLARSQGGLGIGLALVRHLVQMHQGTVSAHSDGPGRGSTFEVRLPVAAGEPPPQASEAGSQAPCGPTQHRRLLVVDDNQDSAQSLALLLETAGHEVHIAYDGVSALAEARSFHPDIVLLDIGLPGMDGYEVARRLRQEPGMGKLLIVAVSGYGRAEDRRRSRKEGFNAHLTKPVDLDALHALVNHPRYLWPNDD